MVKKVLIDLMAWAQRHPMLAAVLILSVLLGLGWINPALARKSGIFNVPIVP
jgi:hypothetical protein